MLINTWSQTYLRSCPRCYLNFETCLGLTFLFLSWPLAYLVSPCSACSKENLWPWTGIPIRIAKVSKATAWNKAKLSLFKKKKNFSVFAEYKWTLHYSSHFFQFIYIFHSAFTILLMWQNDLDMTQSIIGSQFFMERLFFSGMFVVRWHW